jgi:hypothetical protein
VLQSCELADLLDRLDPQSDAAVALPHRNLSLVMWARDLACHSSKPPLERGPALIGHEGIHKPAVPVYEMQDAADLDLLYRQSGA